MRAAHGRRLGTARLDLTGEPLSVTKSRPLPLAGLRWIRRPSTLVRVPPDEPDSTRQPTGNSATTSTARRRRAMWQPRPRA